MAHWSYRVNIRQYLTEDDSPESMLAAVDGIEREVKNLPDALYMRGAKEPLDDMREAAKAGKISWFNSSLNELWDFFDYHRVWVEF